MSTVLFFVDEKPSADLLQGALGTLSSSKGKVMIRCVSGRQFIKGNLLSSKVIGVNLSLCVTCMFRGNRHEIFSTVAKQPPGSCSATSDGTTVLMIKSFHARMHSTSSYHSFVSLGGLTAPLKLQKKRSVVSVNDE